MSRWALCLLLVTAGTLHIAVPGPYRSIVPAPLQSHAATVVALSGACEGLCALLIAVPRTRHAGALATVALFVAVFPANVQMALDAVPPCGVPLTAGCVLAWLRLPLQAPLILWAWSVRPMRAPR